MKALLGMYFLWNRVGEPFYLEKREREGWMTPKDNLVQR